MSVLGSLGQFYTFILLILLFLGSVFAVWRFVNFLMEKGLLKSNTQRKDKNTAPVKNNSPKSINIIGGFTMNSNNGWLKLAVFSFVGVLISIVILGLVSTNSSQAMNMGTQSTSAHQQHVQQGSQSNTNDTMGNMQVQGNMNMNGQMTTDNNMMQQHIYQMQQQINQMQQQMSNMSGNMQMQGNMNNMQNSGSGSMGGMGMNMSPMNSTNNMQQNSGGGMSGMGMM